jgi:hypothetical protein
MLTLMTTPAPYVGLTEVADDPTPQAEQILVRRLAHAALPWGVRCR